MSKQLSAKRKAAYSIGLGMIVVGFFLFISVFFSVFSAMNDPMGFKQPPFQNAVIGMLLIIGGAVVRGIGAKGAAGSGMILDPEKAREDLEPFNRAKGEMINDVLENVDVIDKISGGQKTTEIIKVRCRSCGCLNDEDARFCKSCGREV